MFKSVKNDSYGIDESNNLMLKQIISISWMRVLYKDYLFDIYVEISNS